MTAFTFSVRGTPRPKARARHIGNRVITTTRKTEKVWRAAVKRSLVAAIANRGDPTPLFAGPVRVSMVFTFEPPDSARLGQPHTQKPDKDNLEKLVLDAMEKAGVFRNDSQVAQGPVEKWWGERGGATVLVEQIDAPARPSATGGAPPDWLMASS